MDWFPNRRGPADALCQECPFCKNKVPVKEHSFHRKEVCPNRPIVKRKLCTRCYHFLHPDDFHDHQLACTGSTEEVLAAKVQPIKAVPGPSTPPREEQEVPPLPADASLFIPKKKKKAVSNNNNTSTDGIPTAECPVCFRTFVTSVIESHVNSCLDGFQDFKPAEVVGSWTPIPPKRATVVPISEEEAMRGLKREKPPPTAKWLAKSNTDGVSLAEDYRQRLLGELEPNALEALQRKRSIPEKGPGRVPTLLYLAYRRVFLFKWIPYDDALSALTWLPWQATAWAEAAIDACVESLAMRGRVLLGSPTFAELPLEMRVRVLHRLLVSSGDKDAPFLLGITDELLSFSEADAQNPRGKRALSPAFHARKGCIPSILRTLGLFDPDGFFAAAPYVLSKREQYPHLSKHLLDIARQPAFLAWTQQEIFERVPKDMQEMMMNEFAGSVQRATDKTEEDEEEDIDALLDDSLYSYSDEDSS
jgi:hypothetical protein